MFTLIRTTYAQTTHQANSIDSTDCSISMTLATGIGSQNGHKTQNLPDPIQDRKVQASIGFDISSSDEI